MAEDLGFARLVVNPQCAQNSRGKVELQAVGALAAATLDLQRLAWDLSLFCTEEFGFVTLDDGTEVDVQLDEAFMVVGSEAETGADDDEGAD